MLQSSGRWFDQRQIEALVTGKVVLGEPEEERNQNRSSELDQQQEQTQGGDGQGDKEGEGEADMGPLLQGAPDSPPPTDLNSFLESV